MKKLLAIAVIITAFAASESFAQTGLSGSANVSMTVATGGTITAVQNLLFGTQVQGATNVTIAASSASAAAFTLTGANAGHSYTVTWSNTTLTQGGSNPISWTPSVIGGNTSAQGSAATILSNGTLQTDGSGEAWLWVGGLISSIPSSSPTGTYTGSVTLTLAY